MGEKVCTKEPEEKCYETPRTIRKSVCKPQTNRHCEKFSNTALRPVEKQNCHFENKNKCELEEKLRPRKAKRYSYHKDCKKVPREICDMVERKRVAPNCVTEYRPKCEFVPFVKSAALLQSSIATSRSGSPWRRSATRSWGSSSCKPII